MAETFDVAKAYKKKKEEELTSGAASQFDVAEAFKARKRYEMIDTSDVDENYVKSFFSDASSFGNFNDETAYGRWNKLDLSSKADKIGKWLSQNKESLDQTAYEKSLELTNIVKNLDDHYSQWENEDAYKTDIKVNNWLNTYSGKSYNDLKNILGIMEQGTEEYEWLSNYAPTTMKAHDYNNEIGNVDIELQQVQTDYDIYKKFRSLQSIDSNIKKRVDEILSKYGSAQSLEGKLEQLKAQKYELENSKKYNLLSENEDFETVSKEITGKTPFIHSGVDAYSYINNLNGYRDETIANSSKSLTPNLGRKYDFMTDKEVATYNYIYNTEGKKAANEYLEFIEPHLNEQLTGVVQQTAMEVAAKNPVFSSIGSVPLNLTSGMGALDVAWQNIEKNVSEALTGKYSGPIDYNRPIMGTSIISSTIRGTVSQNIANKYGAIELSEEEHPILSKLLNGKSLGDVYQLGMSMVDSATVAALSPVLGTAGTYLLAGSAATQGILDAVSAGASDEQALLMGIINGAFEAIFEKYELESLLNNASDGFVKSIFKQTLSEGVGEGATTIGNTLGDIFIMAEKSDYNSKIAAYMAQGFSEKEATKQAFLDVAIQVAWDAVGGMASGSIMGAGSSVVYAPVNTYQSGKTIKNIDGGVQKLTDLAHTFSTDSDVYALAEKISNESSAHQTGRLFNKINSSLSEQTISDIASALEAKGMSKKDAQSTAKWMSKSLDGKKFNRRQTKAFDNNDALIDVHGDVVLNADSETNQRYAKLNELYELAKEKSAEDKNGVVDTSVATQENAQQTKNENATENTPKTENATESVLSVSTEGKTTHNGNEVKISSVDSIENGEIMLRLDSGETVNASDVEFGNEREALLYEAVSGMDKDTANVFIQGYNAMKNAPVVNPQSVDMYHLGFNEAFTYGEQGIPYEALERDGGYSKNLAEGQKRLAYEQGKSKRKAKTEQQDTSQKTAKVSSKSYKGEVHVSKIKSSRAYKGLSNMQKASVDGLIAFYKALGIDVYFFESPTNAQGKRTGKNGYYDPATKSIHIDLYAGIDGKGTMLYTTGHELTHFIRDLSPAKFDVFAELLFEKLEGKGHSVAELIATKRDALTRRGRTKGLTEVQVEDLAYEEVVADACEAMLADGKAFTELSEKIKAKDKGLWNAIKKFFTDLVAKLKGEYEGLEPDSVEGKYVAEMLDTAEDLRSMWVDMLIEASEVNLETDFIEIDKNSESISPKLSERTWTASGYVLYKDQMAEKIAKALDVSIEKAKAYIDDINSIAKMIADDRTRLDYEASSFGSAFVSNVEYGGSFDYTTLCKKRRIYTGTFTEIQKRLKDVALSPDDILKIRNLLIDEGVEATCGLCYVEGSRANMGKFAKEFIRLYKRDNPLAWIPNMADVNTPDGVEQMRISHPEAYEQYVYFWNHYGKLKDSDPALFASQQKPKLYEARKEYKGEILEYFKGDSSVEKKNLNGGIRMQSFSDFEIVHLIDTMQVIMDMSAVGLAGQAYTKVPEFAKAFGNTGLKINLSLIAKDVDENGKLIFDDREGMPHKTAFDLRNQYSKNVGTIVVIFTDEQLLAAMADPRIDFIIPFHRSQWKKGQYGAMGLPKGTKDYTYMQNEKLIKPTYHEYRGRLVKDKATNYMPNEYWDFSKSGKENAEAYLKMCAENNKRPKFYKLLDYDGKGAYSLKKDGSTDGYWKLLIDFKMYDNDGVGSPQNAVAPTFNMDEAKTMLDEYKGGHNRYPVANSVVDRFVSEYNKEHNTKYSDRDTTYMDAVTRGDMETAQKMVDEAAKAAGYTIKAYHGTNADFTVFDKNRIGKGVDQYGAGFYFASNPDVTEGYGTKRYDTYLNIKKPIQLISKSGGVGKTLYDARITQAQAYKILKQHPMMYDPENSPLGDFYEEFWEVGAKEWMVRDLAKKYTSIGALDGDVILYRDYPNELHEAIRDVLGYDGVQVYFETDAMVDERNDYFYVAWFDNQMKSSDPVVRDDNGNAIPLSERFNSENNDIRYSDRESADSAQDFVTYIKGVVKDTGKWRSEDVFRYVDEHPQLNFVERIYAKEKNAKSDLEKFLNGIDDAKTLDSLSWYLGGAYSAKGRVWDSKTFKATYPYRGAVTTFRNAVKKRINAIMTEKVNGTNLGIENGSSSLAEVKEMYYRLNSNDDMVEFAEKVFATVEKLGVNIRFVNKTFSNGSVAGDAIGDMVEYKTSYFNDTARSDQHKANTILHELIHICTTYAIYEKHSEGYSYRSDAVIGLKQIYDQIKNDPDFEGQYGIKDEYEMVAELSNDKFVGLLKQKNLWDKIVDWICDLFGIRRGTSAYDNARICVDYLLDNPEVSEYKKYAAQQRAVAHISGYNVFGSTITADGRVMYSDRGNGYDGYSMSNNARDAYADGEMPISKWSKADIVYEVSRINPDIDISKLNIDTLKQKFLRRSSWHHTSMYYNKTDFYAVNEKYVKSLTQQDVDSIAEKQVAKPKATRDLELDSAVEKEYRKVLTLVESGMLKTENGAIKRLVSGKGIDEGYQKAVDLIRRRDASRVDQWRKLPADHYRQEFVKLYDTNIEAYINKMYADKKLSKNSNAFKEIAKYLSEGIKYSDRDTDSFSNRSLLADALEGVAQNDIERKNLAEYREKIDLLNAEQAKLAETKAKIKELSFAKGPRDKKQIADLQAEATKTANRINLYDKKLLDLESTKALKDVLEREKKKAFDRAKQKGKDALAKQREKTKETHDKNDAKTKLQKLVLETSKWLSYPAKDDVKCPDILKEPYETFLNCIDFSSKRLLKGGAPTHNDIKVANAMSSLATAIERIRTAQDPSVTTEKVLDSGYLDLPVNFVEQLRTTADNISKMMVDGDYVINQMSAADVKKITKLIRTLNHAIREMSTLYSNLRFKNVEALGGNTMSFLESMGKLKSNNSVTDFVAWDNALPFYAFKRFGEGGESIFAELMDAQDKLARHAEAIFKFKKKCWNDEDAKAWSEDAHTIELPSGKSVTLTTANAMGIYCLSRREQGLQHLLGGGVRIIGLKKGTKKANDSRSTLTREDIATIVSSLSERQKKVAEDIQGFMSGVCAEWGNEISMKRFLTREFTEQFYYPIESNDENLSAKDPQAQQSDLYRLLNISATKPLTKGANNEVIIRNIFDVFIEHASDMAKLNAFGMPLLDYMKWLNYREKTGNPDGQITVRSVHKAMTTAYESEAWKYVLTLIKDINGRYNDNGDNKFLMNMMRMQKTASVGNNLRVTLLQFTSYPRASMVLSNSSLAKGLTKAPQIEKAKKYCGIALWKSYGFYDTNIARSIESQIKGTTNKRQKLIELSMKGPEWSDAITWGALWNACEYEVAKTTKNKIGSEEFNYEVGLKLREVVYATQVVDSVLTRSQIMRSKSGLTQMATAYMSETTLTANILMDAAFQFHIEKRKTGSAKTAWEKTGKAIGLAVGNYCVLQLISSIAESLADAWRDDDDEEFFEKFMGAFGKNFVSNIIPFNKLPIISDIADLILSQFDMGYLSSDNLSTTWITQIADALSTWSAVLGGKNTTKTVYNAIYKTAKAISAVTGVSVSGAMREVVAVWNNIAGALDEDLKIKMYETSSK